ncbi:MAG: phosphoribosylanthranilate isomerase [Chloroflexi bacterium]|nr:phosphoribosylanthranilate isomerase [Chloroflexota bacterium]
MKVKICGITCLEDALAAINAGAGLLGFNFYPPSPRCISLQDCRRILQAVAGCGVTMVGVFVNTSPQAVSRILDDCGLDLAQLSGDEPPEDLAALGGRAFKALRPRQASDLQAGLERYPQHTGEPAYLLDAGLPGAYGGTGKMADWGLAAGLAERFPLLLAGGLNAANVAAAVRQVRPWGVDVASGVEWAPGRKDPDQVRDFIRQAQVAAAAIQPGRRDCPPV